MTKDNTHWQVNQKLAEKYSIPLDRQLFCDRPLIQILGSFSGKSVLDIGCGNGYLTAEIAKHAKLVIGIDTSNEMLNLARKLNKNKHNLQFRNAAAEDLPFTNEKFDVAVCSMTVNTISNIEMLEGLFKELARVLKPKGKLVISLPNPLTLDRKTKFRWTEWEEGQTLQTLKPGDIVKRKIMGKNGEMITVVNYFWPPSILTSIANKYNFIHKGTLEPKATEDELLKYSDLDPALKNTPFFLVISFDK